MKTIILDFLKWFLIINTGILFIVWMNLTNNDTIWVSIIPQIFCASFSAAITTKACRIRATSP